MEVLNISKHSSSYAVAKAIESLLKSQKEVEMQTAGVESLNQAIKAIAIARELVVSSGIDLVCAPEFLEEEEKRLEIKLIVRKERI